MTSHQIYPSPYGGLPDVNMYEEMQPLENHQQLCLQWKAPTCRLPEATVGTVAQLVSVERHDSPVPMDHPPLVNRQMDRICQPLIDIVRHSASLAELFDLEALNEIAERHGARTKERLCSGRPREASLPSGSYGDIATNLLLQTGLGPSTNLL
ncbi:hypothetical protein HPB50_026562 [Hyalomma asiaticum]|uniref:Uncharacterized protein n=1 Tax=Hyalomma asiaticum TaxID=266040 RepID=A0ACB7TNS0_HYAAI|nr:hypothetical protein HPB50_026562 [Hyalomma asiaticum]